MAKKKTARRPKAAVGDGGFVWAKMQIPEEHNRLLRAAALQRGVDTGQVVSELIDQHLRPKL